MEKLKISLILIVILASSCAGDGTSNVSFPPQPEPRPTTSPNITTVAPITTTVAPNITTVAPNTTTVAPKTTTVPSNTTTLAPNTTTIAPNTTTIAPNTTTVAPNTTTVAPNTTTIAPNTTTVAPNTTTIAPNTTTVAPKPTTPAPSPKPVPDPTLGHWSVDYESSNRSCLGVDLAGQFEFLSQNHSMKLNLSPNATSSGTCSNVSDNLVLRWDNNSVEMDFRKLNTSKYELGEIRVVLNLTWPGEAPRIYTLVHNNSEFSTPLSNSYKCAKVQTLNLTEENKNETIAYFHVSHVQLQAFQNTTGHKFDSAIDCDGSIVTDVVPIVVGCVLAALVVMVLVAYLIGRRRCQARGYLSM